MFKALFGRVKRKLEGWKIEGMENMIFLSLACLVGDGKMERKLFFISVHGKIEKMKIECISFGSKHISLIFPFFHHSNLKVGRIEFYPLRWILFTFLSNQSHFKFFFLLFLPFLHFSKQPSKYNLILLFLQFSN